MSRPTIRDVASAAGVSVTTVSDAINGKGRVDPATRTRVLDAAATVGWRPTRYARAMRSGRTGIIAFCLPRRPANAPSWIVNTDYYMELAAACASTAITSGQLVLLAPGSIELEDLGRLEVDGAIVVDPAERDEALEIFDARGIPHVTVDRDIARDDHWWVASDEAGGTRTLLEHLAGRGAGSVALLAASERWSWLRDSTDAFREWCSGRGLEPTVLDVDLDAPAASAEAVTAQLIEDGALPDAIIGLPYGSALGVIRAATAAGLDVPGDVLVASGVDGASMVTATPRVTALHLGPAALGEAAVALLNDRIAGTASPGPIIIDAELRVREST